MLEYDFTDGWWNSKRIYKRPLGIILPTLWVFSFIVLVAIMGDEGFPAAGMAFLVIYGLSLPVIYLLFAWGISIASVEHFKHFNLPYEMALQRIEGSFQETGEQYKKAIVDERWFNTLRERGGIPAEVLELRKEGFRFIILEMSGGRWVEVADIPWNDGRVTGIRVWPFRGEAEESLVALEQRIDQVLEAVSP